MSKFFKALSFSAAILGTSVAGAAEIGPEGTNKGTLDAGQEAQDLSKKCLCLSADMLNTTGTMVKIMEGLDASAGKLVNLSEDLDKKWLL
jgi:hypothetical protein